MSGRIVFVTGTDTGVGKTWIACALLDALRHHGVAVRAVKPVESGVSGPAPGSDEDGVRLARAAGQTWPSAALCRLEAPLAPPVAADLERRALAYDDWIDVVRDIAHETDLVLVEGAGGLCSPLTWSKDARDLAMALGASALVVAHNRLGVVHQVRAVTTCLSLADLPLLGIVLNLTDSDDPATLDNHTMIERFHPGTPVATTTRGMPSTNLQSALCPLVARVLP